MKKAESKARPNRRGKAGLAATSRITAQKQAEAVLQHHLAMEQVLERISSRLVGLTHAEVDKTIPEILRVLGQLPGVDRAYLAWLTPNQSQIAWRYEWRGNGASGTYPATDSINLAWFNSTTMEKLRQNRIVNIPDVDAVPVLWATVKGILRQWGIRSFIMLPMLITGRFIGYLGINSEAGVHHWSTSDIKLLQAVTNMLGSCFRRLEIEQQLSHNEQRLALAVSATGGGTWEMDLTKPLPAAAGSREFYLSPGMKQLLGYRDNELPNTQAAWESLVHPEDRAMIDTRLQEHKAGKTPEFFVEYRIYHRDGTLRWHCALGRVTHDEQGVPIRWTGIDYDITAQKQAETALQQQLAVEHVLSTISSRLVGIAAADMARVMPDILQTIGQLTGIDRAYVTLLSLKRIRIVQRFEWKGSGASTLYPASSEIDLAPFRDTAPARSLMKNRIFKVSFAEDLPPELDDVKKIWQSWGVQSLLMIPLYQHGQFSGYLGLNSETVPHEWSEHEIRLLRIIGEIFSSCFERLQTEQELAQAQAGLERRVAERTEELSAANRQLQQEIADHAQVEIALRESEERFRLITENMLDLIALLDNDGHYVYLSPSCETVLGYPLADLYKLSQNTVAHPDDLAGVSDWRKVEHAEFRLRRIDGSYLWFEGSSSPVTWRGRSYVLSTARNISMRKKAEDNLQQSYQRLQEVEAIINRSPAMVFLYRVAPGWPVEFATANVSQLGYTPDDFITGRVNSQNLFHPEDKIWVEKEMAEYYQLKVPEFIQEYRIRHRNGEYRWVEDHSRAIFAADGVITHYQGILLDITARKQAEQARREAEQELEAQRALSIRADRLRSLGQMAAGIAHELNQPLVGIRGLAEHMLIAMQREWKLTPEDIQEKLQLQIDQADRMTHIIDHVRLFAREAGRGELFSVDVNAVIHSSLWIIENQLRSDRVELKLNLGENLPLVTANPFSLEEVILNLVRNGRDAVIEQRHIAGTFSGPHLIITTRLAAADRLEITVRDFGTGMPEEVLAKIFEPFFTTKSPDQGTGLGLPICQSLVAQFGGTLGLQTTLRQGTTVTVGLVPVQSESAISS